MQTYTKYLVYLPGRKNVFIKYQVNILTEQFLVLKVRNHLACALRRDSSRLDINILN